MKKIFQKVLVKIGGKVLFKYIENHRLVDEIVTDMIREKKDDFLLQYIKYHTLSTNQITEILLRDEVDELMLAVVKLYKLTTNQQEYLIEKGSVLLLEAYLSPKGFFDTERRFNTVPEYKFIYGIAKSEKLTGFEIFKAYVDNFYRSLLSKDLVDFLVKNENSFATKYIFSKAKLRKEWEEDFIIASSENMLEYYIGHHEFALDTSQLKLVEKSLPLAKVYYDKYKFRPMANQLYHEQRKATIVQNKEQNVA